MNTFHQRRLSAVWRNGLVSRFLVGRTIGSFGWKAI